MSARPASWRCPLQVPVTLHSFSWATYFPTRGKAKLLHDIAAALQVWECNCQGLAALMTTSRGTEQATSQQPRAATKGTRYQAKKTLTSFDSIAQISPSLFINRGRCRVEGATMPWEALNPALKGKAPPRSLRVLTQR